MAAWIGASVALTPVAVAQTPAQDLPVFGKSQDLPVFGKSQPLPNPPQPQALQNPPQSLPDLGDASQALLSGVQERKLGESVMRQIRGSGGYLNDPEVNGYLNELGNRLVTAVPGAPFDFEFFAMADSSINAFALPGGFVAVNSGLILLTQTQHHIARSLGNQRDAILATLGALAAAVLA